MFRGSRGWRTESLRAPLRRPGPSLLASRSLSICPPSLSPLPRPPPPSSPRRGQAPPPAPPQGQGLVTAGPAEVRQVRSPARARASYRAPDSSSTTRAAPGRARSRRHRRRRGSGLTAALPISRPFPRPTVPRGVLKPAGCRAVHTRRQLRPRLPASTTKTTTPKMHREKKLTKELSMRICWMQVAIATFLNMAESEYDYTLAEFGKIYVPSYLWQLCK